MTRWQLTQAARALHAGGVVAYPTEAVWGLGCDPDDPPAVERVLALKGRPAGKGLILIADRFERLAHYLAPIDKPVWRRVAPTWPGPVTWLLPAAPDTPEWLRGAHDTLAVRVTAHPVAAALCRRFAAPVVSTSANRGGGRPCRSALEVRLRFGTELDCILNGPLGGLDAATEIRDARSGEVIRPGGAGRGTARGGHG